MSNKQTSKGIASVAARVLDSSNSKAARTVAASVLTQTHSSNETTSRRVAHEASRILQDNRFGREAKSVAGSALAQALRNSKGS